MAENRKEKGCPQKDSAEHEEYVGASRSFRRIWEERNRVQPEIQCVKMIQRKSLLCSVNPQFTRAFRDFPVWKPHDF